MKRTARAVVAVLLTTGLAFGGFGFTWDFGSGGAKVNGGGLGCCRDAV